MIKGINVKAKLCKPCPLCGSKNLTITCREFYEDCETLYNCIRIECEDCFLEFPTYFDTTDGQPEYNEACRQAVIKWNRRSRA